MTTYEIIITSDGEKLTTKEGEVFNVKGYEYNEDEVAHPEALTLILYNNSAESNRVDKRNYMTHVKTLNGVLRDACSITSPIINYEMDIYGVPTFNYVYIPQFNRFYFVDGHKTLTNSYWEMTLKCDVLMSYRNNIEQLTCYIERSENNMATIPDDSLPTQNNNIIRYVDFPEGDINVRKTGVIWPDGVEHVFPYVLIVNTAN